jgi:hypothetical protein
MVKFLEQNTTFLHPWNEVTLAIWKKYPNPFASHVLTADVIDRYIDDLGRIHTIRLFTKQGKLPRWGASVYKLVTKLFNISDAFILETSVVDPQNRTMNTKTRNLSHRKLLLVEERLHISPCASNPQHTILRQAAQFVSNTSFIPIRARIEKWGIDKFRTSSVNVRSFNPGIQRDSACCREAKICWFINHFSLVLINLHFTNFNGNL